jgi:hypothetical protein
MAPVLLRNRTSGSRFGAGASTAVVVLALCFTLAACSGGGKKKGSAGPGSTQPPKVLAVSTASLRVGKVDIESAGPDGVQIDTATGKAILASAQKYIDNAYFAPLTKGQVGGGYASLFDKGVKAEATGGDKAALTDADVGKVTAFTTKASKVELSALVGTLGEFDYIATDFDITLKATEPSGPLTITHNVELTFAKTKSNWLVTAYRVQTVRKTTTATTNTTAKGGTTP